LQNQLAEKARHEQGEEKVVASLDNLKMEHVDYLLDQVRKALPALKELGDISESTRRSIEDEITGFALSVKVTKLDRDQLEPFFKKPYLLLPVVGKPDSWHLVIPKFVDVQIGYLERSTESYNVFLINRYMDWLGEVPEEIKRQLNWKPPPELTLEGEELRGPPEAIAYARQKYGQLIVVRDGKVKAKPDRAFELIAAMVKDGILPFGVRPVDPSDLVQRRCDYVLRDYQKAAWDAMLKHSAIGVYYPPGTGKTVIALWAATHLKGPALIMVPTRLLQEQWEERVESHTDLKLNQEVFVMTYQTATKNAMSVLKRLGFDQWGLKVFDEQHHQPANTFILSSFIKAKYILGLSATPFREDGREEYIFALSGRPVGLNWDYFKKVGLIRAPTCHVWIVKDFPAKLKQLDQMLQVQKKTIIFSDSLEIGKTVAARFKVPFAYGETSDNFQTILDAPVSVVSRVGDEGLSIPDIDRVIEVSWLGGSRRQELQRTTRLLHADGARSQEQEMHILMTLEEYSRDKKRLFSIYDRGFKLVLHQEGVGEKAIERAEASLPHVRPPIPRSTRPASSVPTVAVPPISTALTQRLPGITKTLERLPNVERAVAQTILGNPQQAYTTKELALATGLALSTVMNRGNFGHLIELGLIRKDGVGKYRSAL
jgi:DNA excision repair protein ERCC-3